MTGVNVSVSAYNDATVLNGCLASIRDTVPDADITVVDGKYESWPSGDANSTDHTPHVADEYNAAYDAAGPFHRERDKHIHRVETLPDGERALFIDADERLHEYHADELNDEQRVAYQPRIVNTVVYGPKTVYWPRCFYPETVQSINRWDAYLFTTDCQRTDHVTIVHRHGWRQDGYREKKHERFEAEARTGREVEYDVFFESCPACDRVSLTSVQATDYGRPLTYVEACRHQDCGHVAVRDASINEYRYVPDRIEEGFEREPRRLRRELIDALPDRRADVFRGHDVGMFVEMRSLITRWCQEEL